MEEGDPEFSCGNVEFEMTPDLGVRKLRGAKYARLELVGVGHLDLGVISAYMLLSHGTGHNHPGRMYFVLRCVFLPSSPPTPRPVIYLFDEYF